MKRKSVVLGGAIAIAMTGAAIGQQQTNTGTGQNPALLGSPGMQAGGGYTQGSLNNQKGYPTGGRMLPGAYNPKAVQNGLTPAHRLPNKNPYGNTARGGAGAQSAHERLLIHRN